MQPTDTERINLIRETLESLAAGEITKDVALVIIGLIVQESPTGEKAWVSMVADRFHFNQHIVNK